MQRAEVEHEVEALRPGLAALTCCFGVMVGRLIPDQRPGFCRYGTLSRIADVEHVEEDSVDSALVAAPVAPGHDRDRGWRSSQKDLALIKLGDTHVLVSASVEDRVPFLAKEAGHGWVTAEYAMLPRATMVRKPRESTIGKVGGRTQEIQRLVGRALRSVTDSTPWASAIWVDCDVLQVDGGTRTALITAGFVALALALGKLVEQACLVTPLTTMWLRSVSGSWMAGPFLTCAVSKTRGRRWT